MFEKASSVPKNKTTVLRPGIRVLDFPNKSISCFTLVVFILPLFCTLFKNQQRELPILLISWPLIDQVDFVPTLNKFCLLYPHKTDFHGVCLLFFLQIFQSREPTHINCVTVVMF